MYLNISTIYYLLCGIDFLKTIFQVKLELIITRCMCLIILWYDNKIFVLIFKFMYIPSLK
jgi:hypothetical protein